MIRLVPIKPPVLLMFHRLLLRNLFCPLVLRYNYIRLFVCLTLIRLFLLKCIRVYERGRFLRIIDVSLFLSGVSLVGTVYGGVSS